MSNTDGRGGDLSCRAVHCSILGERASNSFDLMHQEGNIDEFACIRRSNGAYFCFPEPGGFEVLRQVICGIVGVEALLPAQ